MGHRVHRQHDAPRARRTRGHHLVQDLSGFRLLLVRRNVACGRRESRYDLARLKTIQLDHGWDKATDGFGFFDFLANFISSSLLALVGVALVPLGFRTARMTWLVVNTELLFVVGYMLRKRSYRRSPEGFKSYWCRSSVSRWCPCWWDR